MKPPERRTKAVSAGSIRADGVVSDVTEHKRTEEELRRSQEELENVLASIPDYLWSADIDSQGHVTYRYYLPVVEKITGRPPEFYLPGPERWLSTVHPDDRPRLQAAVKSISTGLVPLLTEEYRIVLPDETVRWVRDSVRVRWEEGRGRVDGVVSDITERKQAEEALRQSEATLREALVAAQMGIWEWTIATDSLTWDENLDRIAGRDPKLLVPSDQKAPQIVTPESWERLKAAAAENTLVVGTPFELDLELVWPDGSKRWLIGRGEPLRDASGHITRLRGTVQDITERKRAEGALRQSEQRYRDFIAHSHEGVWRVEMEQPIPIDLPEDEILERLLRYGYLAECNLAHARNFGCSAPEEMVGRRLQDLVPSSDQERMESFRSTARGGWRSRTVEFRGRDKTGTSKQLLRTEIPIVENGMLVRAWGITRDLTELRQAEEALRESEARYRDFIEHSSEGVWRLEFEQPIPHANFLGIRSGIGENRCQDDFVWVEV